MPSAHSSFWLFVPHFIYSCVRLDSLLTNRFLLFTRPTKKEKNKAALAEPEATGICAFPPPHHLPGSYQHRSGFLYIYPYQKLDKLPPLTLTGTKAMMPGSPVCAGASCCSSLENVSVLSPSLGVVGSGYEICFSMHFLPVVS